MTNVAQLMSIEEVNKEIKRLASIKSRLKKQQGKASYKADMEKVMQEEATIKALRDTLIDKKKTVTGYTEADIVELSYDEVVRAIKSIQSKKSMSKWLTAVEGDNDEYRKACEIERMLRAHKETLEPTVLPGTVKKAAILELLGRVDSLSKEELVNELQALM